MASTEQVRQWFPEMVTNHADRGKPGFEPKCDWSKAPAVDFPNQSGNVYREPVHPATVEAWEAFVYLMGRYSVAMSSAGGVNHCRNIAKSNRPSLHAYLVAVDLPPHKYQPEAFIRAVEKIRTNNGKKVFRNGAGFNDRMHTQLDCSQDDLKTGINWSTVEGHTPSPSPIEETTLLPIIPTSPQEDIRMLQNRLNVVFGAGLDTDGVYGPSTVAAVAKHTGSQTGNASWKAGNGVGQRQWDYLDVGWIRANSGGGSGGLTEAQVKALINGSRITAP